MSEYKYTDSFQPDSTLVWAAFYHRGEKTLFVKLGGVSVYGYTDVPLSAWEEFAASSSAGNFYNLHIKGKYQVIEDRNINLSYIGTSEAKSHDTPYTFVLTGHSPVEYELKGHTLEDAKKDFARLFPDGVLQKVEVKFE